MADHGTIPGGIGAAGAVTVAYVHANEVAHSWHQSLLELVGWDMAHSGRVIAGGWLAIRCGTDGLPASRNEAVHRFLQTDAEWLFWIDTDMGFAPDTVDRLLAAADPTDRPIVGALCFAQRELAPDGSGGYRVKAAPTIYDWVRAETEEGVKQGFVTRQTYEPDTVTRCSGTGSAAILIHRTVLERIRDQYGPAWYNRAPEAQPDGDGLQRMMGEDLSFCMRAGTLDIPVHVHTGVKTTHLKNVWLAEDDYLDQFMVSQIRAAEVETGQRLINDAISAEVPELATPAEWCEREGVEIGDPDGWRGPDAKAFDEPISHAEFQRRAAISTVRLLTDRTSA